MRATRSANRPAGEASAPKTKEEPPFSAGKTKAKPANKTETKVIIQKTESKKKEENAAEVKGKASVKINEEKPGRGNFVVRVSGRDEPIVELLALKRPFPALKQLDMDQVCEDVLKACT